jgi:RNA polymerase sigma-70 factor, ECF subfamily
MSNQVEKGIATGKDLRAVEDLVKRAQNGSMDAFDELVGLFQVQIYNLALRMVNNSEDAADLTQEIFVKVYRSIKGFQGKSKFSTWLFMLAVNTCRSGLRKLNRISDIEAGRLDQEIQTDEGSIRREPVDPGDSPVRILERKDLAQMVKDVIAELDDDFRAVIVLRDVQDLAYEEIAEVLECSVGTVKSRIARARTKMKDKLLREGLTCNAMI